MAIKVLADMDNVAESDINKTTYAEELAEKLGMFNYGYRNERHPDEDPKKLTEEDGLIELKDRDLNKIIENIIRPTINYGAPMITIDEADSDTLMMSHNDDFGPLNKKYAEKTMGFIFELWGNTVELKTYNSKLRPVTYILDEAGFEVL